MGVRDMLRITVRSAAVALVSVGLCVGVGATPAFAVAPDTTITSGPADGALVLPGPVQYTFAAVGPVNHFDCSIDNGQFAACTSPQSFNLDFGTHVFRVRAVNAGLETDQSPATRSWVVRNVPCEQAGDAYQDAQAKFFVQQKKLVKAKKQLHRAHSHGTAAQFQHAKNKVRHIKGKIFKLKTAMNEAVAQEAAVC
jgi:hypothetical protein